jgi:hypothetical protein
VTLTADEKGRISCRALFPPHASFEALKEADGTVRLVRLKPHKEEPVRVRPIKKNEMLMIPMEEGELDQEALIKQIHEEQEKA